MTKPLPLLEPEPRKPRSRSECENGPRPCPWVSCRYHLAIDVNPKTGEVRSTKRFLDKTIQETCALDVANKGPLRLEVVGELMGVTRERIRQIEAKALLKLSNAQHLRELVLDSGSVSFARGRSSSSRVTVLGRSASSVSELDDMDGDA